MRLPPLHQRLLADLIAVGSPYPLAISGGYAVRAHGLVDRRSRDLDLATEHPAAMADIAAAVRAGLVRRGWRVAEPVTDPLSARLLVAEAVTGEECEVNLHKEVLWHPPVRTEDGPVVALDDLVGTRVRTLTDRGLARDLVDVHAAAGRWSTVELEELGRRHAIDDFDLAALQARLAAAEWMDDAEFAAYGLDGPAAAELRGWARSWADDIAERLGPPDPELYED